MALTTGSLIAKLKLIEEFNNKLWNHIQSISGGTVYHAGGTVTLADKVETSTGTSNVTLYALPRFSGTSRVGDQTTTGVVKETNPPAIPTQHLRNVPANSLQHFTLMKQDITPNVLPALTVYNAGCTILRALLHIRPFTSRWVHVSNVGGQSIDQRFANGSLRYAVFVDNPTYQNHLIPQQGNPQGSGTWGAGGNLAYWALNRTSNISSLVDVSMESICPRMGVYQDDTMSAPNTQTMIDNFYNAWRSRCEGNNSFDYCYYSCHLNCHSSCHSSCHGSRSRR